MKCAVAWVLALLAATTGCVTNHRVVVFGRQLHEGMVERHARGQSMVQASDLAGEDGDSVTTTAMVVKREDTVGFTAGARLRLDELERGCPDAPVPIGHVVTESDCPLVQLADSQFELRHYQTRDYTPVITGALGSVVVGGIAAVGFCEYECAEGSRAKQTSDILIGAAVVGLVGLLVWAFLDCSGRWGQAGCRD